MVQKYIVTAVYPCNYTGGEGNNTSVIGIYPTFPEARRAVNILIERKADEIYARNWEGTNRDADKDKAQYFQLSTKDNARMIEYYIGLDKLSTTGTTKVIKTWTEYTITSAMEKPALYAKIPHDWRIHE